MVDEKKYFVTKTYKQFTAKQIYLSGSYVIYRFLYIFLSVFKAWKMSIYSALLTVFDLITRESTKRIQFPYSVYGYVSVRLCLDCAFYRYYTISLYLVYNNEEIIDTYSIFTV